MSTGTDPDFDWTTGSAAEGAAATISLDDFEIPDFESAVDADQIEQAAEDGKFAQPPPGTYLFRIDGFLEAPAIKTRAGFYNGEAVSYDTPTVKVRLRVVKDGKLTNLSMIKAIVMPPSDPKERVYYEKAGKYIDSKGNGLGWFSKEFEQFVKQFFPFAKGEPIPKAAKKLGNWVGKEVIATVKMGKAQKREGVDPSTNEAYPDYPAKLEIELFSFRTAESTVMASGNGAVPATPGKPAPRPPAGSEANDFVRKGLQNV